MKASGTAMRKTKNNTFEKVIPGNAYSSRRRSGEPRLDNRKLGEPPPKVVAAIVSSISSHR